MMGIFRFVGHILLFLAVIILGIDLLRAWQTGVFELQPLADLWFEASPKSMIAAQNQLTTGNGSSPLGGFFQQVLAWPAVIDFLVAGIIFSVLGSGSKNPRT